MYLRKQSEIYRAKFKKDRQADRKFQLTGNLDALSELWWKSMRGTEEIVEEGEEVRADRPPPPPLVPVAELRFRDLEEACGGGMGTGMEEAVRLPRPNEE